VKIPLKSTEPVGRAIRLVALFEGLKGILVLVGGSGLLLLVHKDVHALAVRLIQHSHLNPASRYPEIFLDAASRLHDGRLVLLALGAAVYAAVRLLEAYGLYYGRAWAEVLAAGSGAIYIPVELVEFFRHATALRATLVLANVAVVAIMVRALLRRRAGGARNVP
jgi:uncharacterized membrane protein (DUF2068 family)